MSGSAAINDNCPYFKAQLDKEEHVLDVFGLHTHDPPMLKPRGITSMAVKVDLSLLVFTFLLFFSTTLNEPVTYIKMKRKH